MVQQHRICSFNLNDDCAAPGFLCLYQLKIQCWFWHIVQNNAVAMLYPGAFCGPVQCTIRKEEFKTVVSIELKAGAHFHHTLQVIGTGYSWVIGLCHGFNLDKSKKQQQ